MTRLRIARIALILATLALAAAAPHSHAAEPAGTVPWAGADRARWFALRLRPGQDLRQELQRFAKAHALRAGFVASCAGSLTRASLRWANQPQATVREGHFEIVSLSGTLAAESMHLHASVSDSTGATFGGHLMDGSLVYTTAEIVIGELQGVEFAREPDSTYGYRELAPRRGRSR